ncbi:MAG: hypothetical protein RLZZ366_452, partial [Pseudomonadota bacterium]
FAGRALEMTLGSALRQGVRIVTNAGGLNPEGCAAAIARLAVGLGLKPRIATILGDDLQDSEAAIRAQGCRDLATGESLPEALASITAYTGALPIAQALAGGADVVIAGRAVDSALVLGPLIHEFGWSVNDYDRLAAGSVLGHIIECGAQAAGGLFTDWRDVPDWTEASFPIAECHADGTGVITRVAGSGGLVCFGNVAEQTTYEIGDPQRYLLPDVTCDLSNVRLEQVGPDRVKVSGVKGYPPTATYKATAINADGWRATVSFLLRGLEADAKAARVAESIIRRTELRLRDCNMGPWKATHIELIGGAQSLGGPPLPVDLREVVCRMVVDHDQREAVEMFLGAQRAVSVAMAPGIATVPLGSTATPVYRIHSFLLPKEQVALTVNVDGAASVCQVPTQGGLDAADITANSPLPQAEPADDMPRVPLVALAWGRSGDKGDMSNISIIARKPEYATWIKASLTCDAVAQWFAHLTKDGTPPRTVRHELPGLHAFNFLLDAVLGGGGSASVRVDPMGKALAQQLLDFPIAVPDQIASQITRPS